ncbi:serine/threonine protein phosphatase [Bifidobacterium sp. DSM 109958]|uniref:Serine/threonine protein phosphatase n=1 Tax=Bifidobacterium moraviense TaxID=2675323 RepID=A0A7Y0F209_9BIFI|nr:metallophosphoesterase family protein [Bifidobacterium sp. DSM 109958]NMN00599.1 serine/threonine protein phosphatase [Bifidobacterium sp. DSM 109958]
MATTLRFRHDGTFRVLQMADVQDGPEVDPDTVRLLEAAIREADPDLVVFTGDQIRGYDPAWMRTFLRRRGERRGDRVRVVTRFEAWWRGRFGGADDGGEEADADADAAPLDDARAKVRSCMAGFLGPVTRAGVPFAATYGNHDFQCGVLAGEQDAMYREFPGCLNPASGGADAVEPGTFALPIEASDGSGRVAMSVMMVNSGDYADDPDAAGAAETAGTSGTDAVSALAHSRALYSRHSRALDLADSDGYGTPSPEALAWLADVQRTLGARNGDGRPVPSIVFQHIPPQEFYRCLKEVPAYTPNAVEGVRAFAGRCYVLDREACRPGSVLGESIGCPDVNCGEVETLREAGGYFALFCGHDHKNAFVGRVDGIDLGYAPTCGFASYGPASRMRGVRLFEFHESDPSAYVTRMLTYGALVGRFSGNELRVFMGDHLATDLPGLRTQLRRPRVFVATALTGTALAAAFARAAGAFARAFRRRR